MKRNTFFGVAALGTAAVLFAGTTVFAKLANHSGADSLQVAFLRFFAGLIWIGSTVLFANDGHSLAQRLRPVNLRYTLLRAFFNIMASVFFFLGVQHTTITNANLLNMTSPVYIFLLAPFFPGYQGNSRLQYLFLLFTMVGMYLVAVPDFSSVRLGDFYAALSGLIAGIAITMLHQARKYDSSRIILFYQFALGSLMVGIMAWPTFRFDVPAITWLWLAGSSILGVAAQALLTVGYRYIDAPRGSIISASQILHATLMGVIIFAERLTWREVLGASLIFASLVGVSGVVQFTLRRVRHVV